MPPVGEAVRDRLLHCEEGGYGIQVRYRRASQCGEVDHF